MHALEKERARRYESPSALGADVARYLKGEAVQAAPPSRTYAARKFIRPHRGQVVDAAALLIVLVLGATGTSVGFLRARQNAAEAHEQAVRADEKAAEARRSAAVAQSVNALMTTMIARADRGKEEGRANITVREVMDAGAKELSSSASSYEPGVTSMMAKSIGDTYRELNLYEPSERMMRLHTEQEKNIHGPNSLEYADALADLGEVLKAKGSLDEAATAYEQARSIASSLGDAGADTLAVIQVNTAALLAQKGDVDGAEALLKQAVASCEARSQTKHVAYINGLNNLAAIAYMKADFNTAETWFQKSIDAQRAANGPQSGRELCLTLHNLAGLQYAKHDYASAKKTVDEELALARKLYGDEHLDTASALDSMAMVLTSLNDREGAEKAMREALAIQRKFLPPATTASPAAFRSSAPCSSMMASTPMRKLPSAKPAPSLKKPFPPTSTTTSFHTTSGPWLSKSSAPLSGPRRSSAPAWPPPRLARPSGKAPSASGSATPPPLSLDRCSSTRRSIRPAHPTNAHRAFRKPNR